MDRPREDLIAWTMPEESPAQWLLAVWVPKGETLKTKAEHNSLLMDLVQDLINNSEDPDVAAKFLQQRLEDENLTTNWIQSTKTAAWDLLNIETNERMDELMNWMGLEENLPTEPLTKTDPVAEEILGYMTLEAWTDNLIMP